VTRSFSSVLGLVAVACGGQVVSLKTPALRAVAGPKTSPPAAVIVAEPPVLLGKAGVELKVENLLAEARGTETLAVEVGDLLRIVPSLDPAHLVVIDAAGHALLSQLIDVNGDDSLDELAFQVTLGANEAKTFRIQPGERKPLRVDEYKVYGRFVRERHDDFAFESDRVAHRMYGPDLETWKKEPLTSSGIDVWAKRTKRLVINDWYLTDDYHRDNGDGADLYSVNEARGCGGLGVWQGGKLWVSHNFVRSRVLANGPIRLIFELDYPAYDTGNGKVWETKRVTVDAGRNFNRFESLFKVEAGARPAAVGIGIAKHAGVGALAQLGAAEGWQWQLGLRHHRVARDRRKLARHRARYVADRQRAGDGSRSVLRRLRVG